MHIPPSGLDSGTCPGCYETFTALGQHWGQQRDRAAIGWDAEGPRAIDRWLRGDLPELPPGAARSCAYPIPWPAQVDLILGLLLQRGTVQEPGGHTRLVLTSKHRSLVDWLAEELTPFIARVESAHRERTIDDEQVESDGHVMFSRSHPLFDCLRTAFYSGESDDTRRLPGNYALTPLRLKAAYALSGFLNDDGDPCLRVGDEVPTQRIKSLFAPVHQSTRANGDGTSRVVFEGDSFAEYLSRDRFYPSTDIPGVRTKFEPLPTQ